MHQHQLVSQVVHVQVLMSIMAMSYRILCLTNRPTKFKSWFEITDAKTGIISVAPGANSDFTLDLRQTGRDLPNPIELSIRATDMMDPVGHNSSGTGGLFDEAIVEVHY